MSPCERCATWLGVLPNQTALSVHLQMTCPMKLRGQYGPDWAAQTGTPAPSDAA